MSQEIRPKMNLVVPGEYCNGCSNFKPDVERDDIYANGKVVDTIWTIRCANETLCTWIVNYLNKPHEGKTCDTCTHHYAGYLNCAGCVNKSHWRKIDE